MKTYHSPKPFLFCPSCEGTEFYSEEPEIDDYTLNLTMIYQCAKCGLEMKEIYQFTESSFTLEDCENFDHTLYEGTTMTSNRIL